MKFDFLKKRQDRAGGNEDARLDNFETELDGIAREELSRFMKTRDDSSKAYERVYEEHIRNNIIIDELYKGISKKRKSLEEVRMLCRDQISTARKRAQALKFAYPDKPLPEHKGYARLIRILEENDELPQILQLCLEAKEQGWQGDWDGEIERIKKRMKQSTKRGR